MVRPVLNMKHDIANHRTPSDAAGFLLYPETIKRWQDKNLLPTYPISSIFRILLERSY